VLQAGRVVQDGSPELLMCSDGLYLTLVQREMRGTGKRAA
jgi:hypothetical protein